MIRYENECCNCTASGYPCLGNLCFRRNIPHYYCDKCDDETDIYELDGNQLCIHCIKKYLEKVNPD